MKPTPQWKSLGHNHPVWELVRYFRSLRLRGDAADGWLKKLAADRQIEVEGAGGFKVTVEDTALTAAYLAAASADFKKALDSLRDEETALAVCAKLEAEVARNTTKSQDHHQSPKALAATVGAIAKTVCTARKVGFAHDPQRRAVWCSTRGLHVSARNLDGAIPSLVNPSVVWEIKEYWGKTSGGSKMSDAVYECHLVGRELRDFEARCSVRVVHVVFVDGREQWEARKSDLIRFIDLFHQGLIDHLLVGRDVETEWQPLLESLLPKK